MQQQPRSSPWRPGPTPTISGGHTRTTGTCFRINGTLSAASTTRVSSTRGSRSGLGTKETLGPWCGGIWCSRWTTRTGALGSTWMEMWCGIVGLGPSWTPTQSTPCRRPWISGFCFPALRWSSMTTGRAPVPRSRWLSFASTREACRGRKLERCRTHHPGRQERESSNASRQAGQAPETTHHRCSQTAQERMTKGMTARTISRTRISFLTSASQPRRAAAVRSHATARRSATTGLRTRRWLASSARSGRRSGSSTVSCTFPGKATRRRRTLGRSL
mmetsp:Transcript_33482/g.79016  ORF Transcript_33482/g.79016 Transcript_33482/m.79016 type:complete len:275 (+) Transcript_33482:1660-2484(+)